MIVVMKKQSEDAKFVWYKFNTEIQVDEFLDKKGRMEGVYEYRYGLFKFNKIDPMSEESFKFIKDETDPVFWDKETQEKYPYFKDKKRIKLSCRQRMYFCKKNNDYKDIVEYASC